jgi:TPR repeat protein
MLLQWQRNKMFYYNIERLKQRAATGDAEAQYNLGIAYQFGDGAERKN